LTTRNNTQKVLSLLLTFGMNQSRGANSILLQKLKCKNLFVFNVLISGDNL
jgi:hypothetical protein